MIALLPNCAFLSETSRMLRIAQALHARGAEVMLATQGGPYEYLLEGSGLQWHRLAPGLGRDQALRFVDRLTRMGFSREELLSRAFIREAVAAEAEFLSGAELAVTGFDIPSLLSSRLADVPIATSHGGSYVPPVFERNLCPAPTQPPLAALRLLPRVVNQRLANAMPPRVRAPLVGFNAVADELGVARIPSVAAAMCGDLTLVTDVPEVLGIPKAELEAWRGRAPHYRPGTRLRYVGPLYAQLDLPIPEEVQAFVDGPGPVVYVAPTSCSRETLVAIVEAVRKAGARTLVASTVHDVQQLADDDTCIAGVLPNHRVMPQVDLAVTMGGQGSVQCAVSAGVPIIGFPLQVEQEFNLALVERQGAGVRLPLAKAGSRQLTHAVRKMLGDPRPRENARRLQSFYAGVDGAANAAEAIFAYLGRRA